MKRLKKRAPEPTTVKYLQPFSYPQIAFVFLASAAVSCLFYSLFYHYSPVIWSFGANMPADQYTLWTRAYYQEKDGIELFVMYPMVIAIMLAAFFINRIFDNLSQAYLRKIFLAVAASLSIYYYLNIKFVPPMAKSASGPDYLFFMVSVAIITWALSLLYKQHKITADIAIILSLIPVCFISTYSFLSTPERFLVDFGYILSPAIRIAKGISPKAIYLQYDYLIPFLLSLWIKLALPVIKFKFIGACSYYALFLGIYFLARRLFRREPLALYLLIAVVIVRIYGNIHDPTFFLHATPLRLDLWIIPLVLSYYKGPSHWSVGLSLSCLMIFHHSFGLIYTLSYILFIMALFLFGIKDNNGGIKEKLKKRLYLYVKNLSMILAAVILHKIFFESRIANAALYYQQSGVGFLPISKESFYWHFIPIMSATLILLALNRKELTGGYFSTGIFLLILAAGNSLYFFGRSHENNMINMSSIALFVLFMCFDITDFSLSKIIGSNRSKLIVPAISIAVIMLCASSYSGVAAERIRAQAAAFAKGQFTGAFSLPDLNTQAVRKVAGPEGKVVFLSMFDSYYYLESGYTPEGYYGFIPAWIVKKDLIDFLNDRLVKGCYISIPAAEYGAFNEIVSGLHFLYRKNADNYIIISDHPFKGYD